ncbi:MAG: FG-GAP-like repeat-containing protein [Gemmatimonadales bacterium]
MRMLSSLATAASVLAGCTKPAPSPEWHEETGYRWRDLASAGRRSPGFTRMDAERTGITFANTVSDSAAFRNRHLMQGSGVAIGDVNGDGRPDIYLARIEGPNALYLNDGDWHFHDVAAEAGVTLGDRPSTGAVLADIDGDGDLDLLVGVMAGRNALFLNDGTGRFRDATAESGFVPEGRGTTTLTLADVDGDGDLDLYVANYKARTMLDSLSPQQRAFDQIVKRTPRGLEVIPERRADYRLQPRPELKGVTLVQRADPDWFYRNEGGRLVHEPIAHNPRFLDENGRPLADEPDWFGLAARFYDVNGDGAPDLYVANDFEDPDQFWINDGKGNFRLINQQAIRRLANSNMAVDFADIDRDGHVDLFQVDMLANDHRNKTQVPTHTTFSKIVGEYSVPAQWQRNALLWNRGDGTFAEIADFAGVAASGWSWSALFLDVDLDGYEDLLIGNGHTWDLMDVDTQERLKSTFTGLDWREERRYYPELKLRNVAFRNRGDRTFEHASAAWRWGTEEDISHGMAAGDLDGDGDLDLVVNRLGTPAAVMRNDAAAPRLAVRLAGSPPNTHGIGARVTVKGGAVPEQAREVTAGGLYLSGSDAALSFATGPATTVTLEIRWRSGAVTTISDAVPGRLYEVRESGIGTRVSGGEGEGPSAESRVPSPAPLFEDVSGTLNAHHAESFYNDYVRQPLIHRGLSQLGPGVTWVDVNRDDRPDLIIPDGDGGELAWYRNQGGRFTRVPLGYPAGQLDFTMALVLPNPEPHGLGASLVVGRSSYQARTAADAFQLAGVARLDLTPDGLRVREAVGVTSPDSASVGALALADLDADGDLDLFVAGRVIPGAWPLPTSSRLYRNDNGRFVPDPANDAVLRGVGPVSAARFTDLNGDGWPDLVLATDGGPIKVFMNQRGRLTDATARWGLDRYLGMWNGVAAGDFDGDGRMDLVATNWGRNLTFSADSAQPLYLYIGSFGAQRSVDVIPAAYDSVLRTIAPIASLTRLSWALPALRRRIPTFKEYAGSPIEKVLGAAGPSARRLTINTLDHLVFLNRGARFEARPLPDEAQWAPGFGLVVGDFDGDGKEDLFLAQNFSQTETGTPRFDAGRGLMLLGDGTGGFHPMPGQASGIVIYGDQRGAAAADFDGDGRLDLAVSQNAAEAKLYRNTGGAPGLRVRLAGPAGNPDGIGAMPRVRYPDGDGPLREIAAGSGYWSQDGAVAVLGLRGTPRSVLVRWPGGGEQEVTVAAGQRELQVKREQ